MKIRGARRCQDCGREWSYYETGEVACPTCGSLRSVGVDERTTHTDSAAELDLSPHRSAFEETPRREFAGDLKSTLREYRRRRGFISGGDLLELDDTYLAASELLHAADVYARLRDPSDEVRLYVMALLGRADRGERPAAGDVPDAMTAARGLGYVEAVGAYRRELSTWLDDHPDPAASEVLGTVREHTKRVEALQGDVPPEEVEAIVRAVRDVSRALREDDESALAGAQDRLARL
ncbi:MAG: hypothetical protein ABEJ28_07905 [Salinigranum sp.]